MGQTSTESTSSNVLYYCHSCIGLLLIFAFGYLPPIAPLTPVGMHVLGIFMGMIYLWSFVSILWPSLVGIIFLGLCGYAPMRKVLLMAFGDVVPVLVLFAMVLFGAIQHAGVTRYISRWFLTRKIINGKPVMFSFVFLYTTYILAALSANVLPALLLMWAILYSVLTDVGYKKGDPYTAIMVLGTMFAAICGQAAKPFTGSALVMVGAFEKNAKASLDYLPYMLFGIIMSTICIVGYSLLIKFVFRPDMSKIQDISTERFAKEALAPMDLQQKTLFVCLFAYLLMVLLPSLLPKSIAFVAMLNKLGAWGVVILFVAGLSLFKINNKPIIDFKEVAGKYIVWDVFFLVCMSIVISDALTAESTGITEFLTTTLTPILGGHSALMFTIIMLVLAMVITQIANNAVMGVLFMPIIKVFCEQSGGNFVAVATIVIFGLHMAILTPASSPYAAILYGNKDWISQKEIVKYGGVAFCFAMLVYALIGIPLSNMIHN